MASEHQKRKGKNSYLCHYGLKTDMKNKRLHFYNKRLRNKHKKDIQKDLEVE